MLRLSGRHSRLIQPYPNSTMHITRSSGILLHLTSLPGEFGIGDLGREAYQFVDFLAKTHQSLWQVLPLGPTAFGDSPYSSYSAFAGNPLLISLSLLADDSLLSDADVDSAKADNDGAVDFNAVRTAKEPLLRKAFDQFASQPQDLFHAFCEENAWWLTDFARFRALSLHFQNSNWSQWEEALVRRDENALAKWDEQLADEIAYTKFLQFTFYTQWSRLKDYANENGVKIFGDMPIFVGYDSADVWANQELFFLDESGNQTVVAGVPPDYFSETGQRWGNPLYRWDVIGSTGYKWWTNRFRHAFNNFDLMRIDHFRGFEAYWEVQADCPTAVDGQWCPGPGAAPFLAAQAELGVELPIVAEDLGLITDEVHQLRDELGFPGMRVFQFGFDVAHDPYHRPEAYPEHSAAYTGTHDNETIMGWYQQRKADRAESGSDDPLLDAVIDPNTSTAHLDIVRSVFGSPAELAIIPLQDLLGLGNEARMNTPGEAAGNWGWRCLPEHLCDAVAAELEAITIESNRRVEVAVAAPV